jgi:hypothetical protein
MARRITSNLVMLIVLVGIIFVPVYWIAQGGNYQKTSTVEGKFLSAFKSSSEALAKIIISLNHGNIPAVKAIIDDQVIHRGLQKTLEQAAAEQFPFRLSAIKASRFFDRLIIRLVYSFLPDKAIPTDMQSGLYIDRQYDFLTYAPSNYTKSEKRVIDKRIDNYATLLRLNPGIHFHAFYFERLQFSSFHPLNKYFPGSDNGRSFLYFEEGIPHRLLLAKMMLASLDDHTRYFYRTDHHWNIQGALKAYDIIYGLLATDFPDISPPV